MRKLYYILPALLCLWLPGRTQIVTDTASIEVMIERAFSELDYTEVATGIMQGKPPLFAKQTNVLQIKDRETDRKMKRKTAKG